MITLPPHPTQGNPGKSPDFQILYLITYTSPSCQVVQPLHRFQGLLGCGHLWGGVGMLFLSTTVQYLTRSRPWQSQDSCPRLSDFKARNSTTPSKTSLVPSVEETIKSQSISAQEGPGTFRIINWGLLKIIIIVVTKQTFTILVFVSYILYVVFHFFLVRMNIIYLINFIYRMPESSCLSWGD